MNLTLGDFLRQRDDERERAKGGDPELAAFLAQRDQERATQTAVVLEQAVKDNPDVAAARARFVQKGVPFAVADRNLDRLKAAERTAQIDLLLARNASPTLRAQMGNPLFAPIAAPEVETLASIERSLREGYRYLTDTGDRGALADVGGALRSTALGATVGVGKGIFELAGAVNDLIGFDSGAAGARGAASRAGAAMREAGFAGGTPDRDAVRSGFESLGLNLAMAPLGLWRGAGAATSSAGAAGSAAGVLGTFVGAEAYNRARESGRSTTQAGVYGLTQGSIEYVFENMQLGALFGDIARRTGFLKTLGRQLVVEGLSEQATTFAQDFTEWITLNPEKTAMDFIRERPAAARATLIAAAIGAGGQTTAVTALNKAVEKITNKALKYEQDLLQEQMRLVTSLKLRERSPEQLRDFMSRVVDETPNERKELFVDAEVLNQLSPELLAQLPETVREQIAPALLANAPVAIPLADALAIAPGTPMEEVLNQHGRLLDPNAPSKAEAEAYQTMLAEDAERIAREAADSDVWQTEVDTIRETIATELGQVGRFSAEQNNVKATLAANFYATQAHRLGITPAQMFERYRLRVGRMGEQTTADQELEQSRGLTIEGFHYSKAERPMVSTGAFGTGLQGSNRDQYLNAADTRLRNRAYFYADKGTGITPEAGVGGIGHKAQLRNVYDADADPLRLKQGRDALSFESAVLDAGFAGYLSRQEGTQPAQVIMLGDQVIPTEVLGPLGKTSGQVVPAPAARESRGRDQVVDRLKANKALPMGSMPRAMWSRTLEAAMPVEHAAMQAAGVFDGEGNLYKDELIRDFIAKTPAEVYNQRAAGDTTHVERAKALLATITPPKRSAVGIMRGEVSTPTFKNLFELSRWFTARNARGAEDMNDPAVRKRIMEALYADTLMALTDTGSAVGWYDTKVKAALDLMAQAHPEIATDEQARFGFIAILAITSNQTRVNENFELADALYSAWKSTGRLPTDVGAVRDTRAKTEMSKGLSKLNDLVGQHGWERVRSFMTTKQTAREIEQFTGWKLTGENVDSMVYGATFLGPKIGAFFNNLYGNFDTVTMDRWFMRTINRIRGSMLAVPSSLADNLAELRRQLEAGVDTFGVDRQRMLDEIAAFEVLPNRTAIEPVLKALPAVREYVSARHKVFAKGREVGGKERSYVDRTPENQLAKNIDLALHLDQQTPRNGGDRVLMREIVLKLQQKLQNNGIDMVVADIQAALWYYEKDLVAKLRGKDQQAQGALFETEQEAEDYETAARRVVARYAGAGEPTPAGSAGPARPGAAASRAVDARVDTTGDLFQSGASATLDDFTPGRVAGILNKDGWAILTAENPAGVQASDEANAAAQAQLRADVEAAGFDFVQSIGRYGNVENPLILTGITEAQAVELGRKYGQDSVLTRKGLTYMRDGSVTPATGRLFVYDTPPADFYTEIPSTGTYFAVELDFEGQGADSAAAAEAEFWARLENDFEGLVAEYATIPGTLGGRVLNTDEARELSPWYRADRTRSADIHEPASEFVKRLYAKRLAEPTPEGKLPAVLFTAGGTGAGKSSSLELTPNVDSYELIYDTNMNTMGSADKKVQQALAAGRQVVITLTVRDPVEAMVLGALPRAMRMGRTVPISAHAETHRGARAVVETMAEKYKDDPRVEIRVVDNTRGRGNARVVDVADAPVFDYNGIEEKLYEAATAELTAGRISPAVFAGTTGVQPAGPGRQDGAGTGGQPQPQDLAQRARGAFSPAALTIRVGPDSDLSTFEHELGHFFLEVMADLAAAPDAPAQVKTDMDTLLKWFKVQDLATWQAMSLDEKRPHHERLAESFEQYLFEGKAPTSELQGLFRQLRAFMIAAYKSLSAFMQGRGLQLNDDVRKVFDRMIATDEAIAEHERVLGLVPNEEATAEAIERLQKRSLANLKWLTGAKSRVLKSLQKEAAAVREFVEAGVRTEVYTMPVYRAERFIRYGKLDESTLTSAQKKARDAMAGGPVKMSLASLKAMYGDDPAAPWRYLPTGKNGLAAADGVHPDLLASMLGFKSGDALVRELLAAEPVASVIEGMTDRRMLEDHGDLATPEALEDAANEAIHNKARAMALATELKGQAEAMKGARNPKSANELANAARMFGEQVVARTLAGRLKATAAVYRAAEARAARAWLAATQKGDTAAAVKAKRDQLLNHAVARAAGETQAELRKVFDFFAKVAKGSEEKLVKGGRDPDVVNAMRAILAAYGVREKMGQSAMAYLETVKARDPVMYGALAPSLQAAQDNARPLTELNIEELRGLHEELRAMWALAKRSRQAEIDGDLLDRDDMVDTLLARLEARPGGIPSVVPGQLSAITDAEERTAKLRTAKSILTRVEQWTIRMDGGPHGYFNRYIFTPIKEAADRYRDQRVVYRKKLTALMEQLSPNLVRREIVAPELNYTFNADGNSTELIHALLHTGNESNKRKLLLGHGWAMTNQDGSLDSTRWDAFIARMHDEGVITKAHWDFAQAVWDTLEELKPAAQETHRRVFGRYFKEVEAAPVVTPFGTYRGGYVPATTDARQVNDKAVREMIEAENESITQLMPSAPTGFTKSRSEGYAAPLLLDLRLLAQHTDKVLLFTHMQGPINDVRRLLGDKRLAYALNRVAPGSYESMLLPWLDRSAKQVVETPILGDRKLSRLASAVRSNAGMALMMANLSNAAQQLTGFSAAAVLVKPSLLLGAAASALAGPKAMREAVANSSTFMRNRMLNEVAALNDTVERIMFDPSVYERAQTWTKEHAYFLQAGVDNFMSPIIWTAAYNQAVQEGQNDVEAVRFADSVIRRTQGTTLPEDVSRFETGSAPLRLFTQFISYFNMMANTNGAELANLVEKYGLRKGAGKLAYVAAMGVMVPIWVAEAIAVAFRGGPEDEDKDGEYLDDWIMAIFGMGTARGLLAQVPIVGMIGQGVMSRFNSNPADDKFSLSPAVSLIESSVNAPFSVYKAIAADGSAQKAIKDSAAAATMLTGLPFYAAARPISYAAGVEAGQIRPRDELDLARGMLTGSAPKDTRVRN